MKGIKQGNEYAQRFGRLYAETPKAVFAAVLASYMDRCSGTGLANAERELRDEWDVLNQNGIVSQRPPRAAMDEANEIVTEIRRRA